MSLLCYRLVILTNWVVCQHCTSYKQWCIFVHMKLELPIWRYLNWCFHVLLLDLIPSFFRFCDPDKGCCFLHQLNDWCHDKRKVLNEKSIKLNHTIKNLNLLWIGRYWHIHYCLNFLKVWYFSFLGNHEPQNQSWKYHKGTFLWVKTDYIFFAFLKTKFEFHQMIINIIINYEASKNIFMNCFKYYLKVLLIAFWKIGGPFFTPNGIAI